MEGLQMGFIGQEAINIVPEIVSVKNDHYSMQYAPVTALLVEGMKEQQKQIESFRKENQQLKSELDELKAQFNNFITNQAAGQGNK
jgi:predicted RNase H-like nuclease (RuvC/YqgF family)